MSEKKAAFLVAAAALRPEVHRYCARITGSVVDGEDVVQDALVKAVAAVDGLDDDALPPVRPWLFRIAHNRAIDVLRAPQRRRDVVDVDDALVDAAGADAEDVAARAEAVKTAVARFVALPVEQRSAVVLKDVLDASLDEIAGLLDVSVDAVKGHLARGRARLRSENVQAAARATTPTTTPTTAPTTTRVTTTKPPSAELARYVRLFNARDWDALRALLADDVKLRQALRPPREGKATVREFFTFYAAYSWVRAAPALLRDRDGDREVVAVYNDDSDRIAYFTVIEFKDGRVVDIRDHRYLDYIARDADLVVNELTDQTNQNS